MPVLGRGGVTPPLRLRYLFVWFTMNNSPYAECHSEAKPKNLVFKSEILHFVQHFTKVLDFVQNDKLA